VVKHCWVTDRHGRLSGLLLEWRRVTSGWQGRVVRPALEAGEWIVVEEWLPAELLAAVESRCVLTSSHADVSTSS
jgi:hypothetical protein